MKKNRVLVFLLALVVLMTAALPAMAEGEEPKWYECENFWYILLDDGTAEIVYYNSDDISTKIKIPDQLDGYTVSSVSGNPFRSDKQIINFDVAPGNPYFAVIDGVLFSKADKRLVAYPRNAAAESYSVPQGIRIIGDSAFYDCESLQSITIPDSVTSIGNSAFNGCEALQSVTLSENLAFIGGDAFGSTALLSITIPDSVASIGGNPFWSCNKLSEIIVSSNHPCLEVRDGLLIYKSDEEIRLVTYPYTFTATEFTVPEDITSIGDSAFSGCKSLQSITIPGSVASIGEWTFSGCEALQSVTIENGVTFIGDGAFRSCTSLQSVTIPGSVTSIGYGAFDSCESLQSVTIENGVTSIGGSAFYECESLQSVTIPDSVTSIGGSAFYGCESLQSVTIPDSVTSIGYFAFDDCESLTVTQGSYAETYAIENDLTYTYPNSNDWLLD